MGIDYNSSSSIRLQAHMLQDFVIFCQIQPDIDKGMEQKEKMKNKFTDSIPQHFPKLKDLKVNIEILID